MIFFGEKNVDVKQKNILQSWIFTSVWTPAPQMDVHTSGATKVCNINFMSGQITVKFEACAITFLFPFAVQITCVLRHQKHEHAFLFSPLRLLLWILEILVVCSPAYISIAFDSSCLTWSIYTVPTSPIILPQYLFVLFLL